MLRDRSGARRAKRRRAALAAIACIVIAGCGIKGPLKRPDAAAPAPPVGTASPSPGSPADGEKTRLP